MSVNRVTITEPAQGDERHVRRDKICAKGNTQFSIRDGGTDSDIELYARIYNDDDPGTIPLPNEPDTTDLKLVDITDDGGDWVFSQNTKEIGNAKCSDAEPWNTLVVWAKFPSGNPQWAHDVVQFRGECRATTDCE